MPSNAEYQVALQSARELYCKIDLLNFDMQRVGSFDGNVIGEPSFTISSTSDIRRTCSIQLYPTDSSFDIVEGSKVWLDKYIQVYVGIKDIYTDEIVYTNMGLYLIENPSRLYEATTNILTIQGIDLMARLTGLRNGALDGVTYVIPAGSNVRSVILGLLQYCNINKYRLAECEIDVPNKIEIDRTGTVYDILVELVNILPSYQIYFDVDGTFVYDKIPNGLNEQVFIDDTIWNKSLISYESTTSYDSIKNYIYVYGGIHKIKNYCETVTEVSDYLILTCDNVTSIDDGLMIGFIAPSNISILKVRINTGTTTYTVKDEKGNNPDIKSGDYCVIRYNGTEFVFKGGLQPQAIAKCTNPDSPYYIGDNEERAIRLVLEGGEYDNISSDILAQERANYELYLACNLNDTITINTVPIYWADVNKVIEITLPTSGNPVKARYIIKEISTSVGLASTQSMTCMRYYPLYPSI